MSAQPSPKRLILFAGYNANTGAIRRSDIELIRELSRFGDVHCWYDNKSVADESLSTIREYAASISVGRHEQYDFGSWKFLYQTFTGNQLDAYDELVLTNNSLLLLDKLDYLFAVRSSKAEDFFAPLMLDEDYPGPDAFIEDYENRYDKHTRSVMYASIFWSLRRDLFRSDLFENFINTIQSEDSRLDVCHKYERGFSRRLWRNNVSTATLFPRMFHHVALYTEDAFLLPSLGFPFIKYKALQQDFFDIPDIRARSEALLRRTHADYRGSLKDALNEYAKLDDL